jgi:hypothetical protein
MVARLKLKEIDGRAPPGVKSKLWFCPEQRHLRGVGGCLENPLVVVKRRCPPIAGTLDSAPALSGSPKGCRGGA